MFKLHKFVINVINIYGRLNNKRKNKSRSGFEIWWSESRAEGTYIKKEGFVHRTASTCSTILTATELMGFCYNEQKQEEQEWSSQKHKTEEERKNKKLKEEKQNKGKEN